MDLYTLKRDCSGTGINHEGKEFEGTLQIQPAAGGKGLKLSFKAVGSDGTVFHDESSLIGPGFDGKPCLFVLSNNHPGVIPHGLKREDSTSELSTFIFGFGDVTDRTSFREEIALLIGADGSVEYKYSWGLPGGEYQERSGAKMLPNN